jgi:outer membrane lipoprotein-sorting protein
LTRNIFCKLGALMLVMPALTGCLLPHHRTVLRVTTPVVQISTVDQLVKLVNERFDAVQSLNASVEIAASVGGSKTGNVTDYTAMNGYILLRKPTDMRVLLLVPVLHTTALDMVSNGTDFKMYIKAKNRAIVGTETITEPSKNPLENLRPSIFRDSLLVRGISGDNLVSMTSDTQVLISEDRKHATELLDYDLNILRRKGTSNQLETLRVIHINRTTLLPYQQDIYDEQGRLATVTTYDKYELFGAVQMPTELTIKRPLDEYQIKMTVNKLTLNQKMGDEQFELKIPDNVPTQKMM